MSTMKSNAHFMTSKTAARLSSILGHRGGHMLEKACKLQAVVLASPEQQDKVRKIAKNYLFLAEKNDEHFENFKQRIRDQTPPKG
jgi:hypothetical protein